MLYTHYTIQYKKKLLVMKASEFELINLKIYNRPRHLMCYLVFREYTSYTSSLFSNMVLMENQSHIQYGEAFWNKLSLNQRIII